MNREKKQTEKEEEPIKSENVFELSEKDLEEIRLQAKEKAKTAKHKWIQKGPYLVCTSCEYEHGYYIGIAKRLKGYDKNGSPVFETRGKV